MPSGIQRLSCPTGLGQPVVEIVDGVVHDGFLGKGCEGSLNFTPVISACQAVDHLQAARCTKKQQVGDDCYAMLCLLCHR